MKKVILTEAQVRFLVTEDGLARLLLESLNESINYEDLKRKIRRALAVGVSLAVIIPAINKLHAPEAVKDSLRQLAKTEVLDSPLWIRFRNSAPITAPASANTINHKCRILSIPPFAQLPKSNQRIET